MGEHIVDGQFQSDKYPWCKPGFVPLKITDPMAWPCLRQYAERRALVDPVFSADLIKCVEDELNAYIERENKKHREKYGMKEVDALLDAVQDANEDEE